MLDRSLAAIALQHKVSSTGPEYRLGPQIALERYRPGNIRRAVVFELR
jgi:hypothetical protein